MLKSKMHKTLY